MVARWMRAELSGDFADRNRAWDRDSRGYGVSWQKIERACGSFWPRQQSDRRRSRWSISRIPAELARAVAGGAEETE